MRLPIRLCAVLTLLSALAFLPSGESQDRSASASTTPASTVYVCACLRTKSCSCMTEAKMEGPCACGTQGGPPLKPVPSDSDWARANREMLAR